MGNEILSKSGGEDAMARARITRERAGLPSPVSDLSHASPQERYLHLVAGLGDAIERELRQVLPPRTASAVRDSVSTWQAQHGGCQE
jgi:hypothetical protein